MNLVLSSIREANAEDLLGHLAQIICAQGLPSIFALLVPFLSSSVDLSALQMGSCLFEEWGCLFAKPCRVSVMVAAAWSLMNWIGSSISNSTTGRKSKEHEGVNDNESPTTIDMEKERPELHAQVERARPATTQGSRRNIKSRGRFGRGELGNQVDLFCEECFEKVEEMKRMLHAHDGDDGDSMGLHAHQDALCSEIEMLVQVMQTQIMGGVKSVESRMQERQRTLLEYTRIATEAKELLRSSHGGERGKTSDEYGSGGAVNAIEEYGDGKDDALPAVACSIGEESRTS